MFLSNKKSKCFIYSFQLKVNKVWRDSILKEMFLFTSVVKTFGFLDWIRLTAVKTSISLSKRNCCRTLYNTMNNAVALLPSLMIEKICTQWLARILKRFKIKTWHFLFSSSADKIHGFYFSNNSLLSTEDVFTCILGTRRSLVWYAVYQE